MDHVTIYVRPMHPVILSANQIMNVDTEIGCCQERVTIIPIIRVLFLELRNYNMNFDIVN